MLPSDKSGVTMESKASAQLVNHLDGRAEDKSAGDGGVRASGQRGPRVSGIGWYFGFFIVSGFCSLVYEVVWLRLAMAEFGVTTALVSIVLSVFMAGLGLGSWGAGALTRRLGRYGAAVPLRLYALCELLIGASGFIVPQGLSWGHRALETGKGLAGGSSAYYPACGLWLALTMVPWCACMGATLPFAMSAIGKSFRDESPRSFSYLYLANVIGAVLGTFVPAFFLIELMGFQNVLHLTSGLNAVLAASAFLLSLTLAPSALSAAQASARVARRKLYGLPERAMLCLLFATGVISMAMEVIWIREFTPYLGNVVYAFATILAFYLVATSTGSWIYRQWIRSRDPNDSGWLWGLLGLLGLIALVCADPRLPLPSAEHSVGFLLAAGRAAIGVMPFSALVGFLTPMLVDHWSSGDPDLAGSAYAVNVVGSIVGPLLAGFGLLPWIGERWALFVVLLPLFGIGLAAARGGHSRAGQRRWDFRTALRYLTPILLALLVATTTEGYEDRFPDHRILRDYVATVVAAGKGQQKVLLVNGIGMTNLGPVTKIMAHLPLAFLDRQPKTGLVVCFGMGTTFRSMMSWGVRSTAVDLVPSVPAMFGYFHADGPELERSPLARVVIDDGRRFLEMSREKYDVITSDPPPPVGAPTSSLLYSREYYAVAKEHLAPDGIVQVWLPGGDAATKASVALALRDSFPYLRAFQAIDGSGLHFLASERPIAVPAGQTLASRLPPAAAADLIEWGPASTPERELDEVLSREQPIEALISADPRVPPLRDDQPINEYFLLRRTFHWYR